MPLIDHACLAYFVLRLCKLSSRVDLRPCSQTPSSAAVFSRFFAPSRVCHVDNRPMTPGVRVGKGLRMFVDLSFPLGRAAARFHVRRRAGAQLLEENQRFKSHLGLHGGMWSCVCVLALNKVVECPSWAVVTALGLEDTMSSLPLPSSALDKVSASVRRARLPPLSCVHSLPFRHMVRRVPVTSPPFLAVPSQPPPKGKAQSPRPSTPRNVGESLTLAERKAARAIVAAYSDFWTQVRRNQGIRGILDVI